MEVPREKYYSQTEACKLFKSSVKQFKQLIEDNNIQVVSKTIDVGDYAVNSIYVLQEEFDKLNLSEIKKATPK